MNLVHGGHLPTIQRLLLGSDKRLEMSIYRVNFSTAGSPRFTSAMKLRRLGSSGISRVPVWDILVGDSPVAQRSGLFFGAFLSYMKIYAFVPQT